MLLKEIAEMITRLPDGGVINSNDRWDYGYLYALVRTYRARLHKANFINNKRINPVCYQKHWPEYEELLQDEDGCTVKFRHPEVISLDDRNDGFRYIGGVDCASNLPRIQSRAWASTFNDNRVTKVNTRRRASVLYDGNAQILEVFGDPEIEEILTESLLADPLSIPTFNYLTDPYPLSDSDVNDVISMIFNDNVAIEARVVVGNSPGLGLPTNRKR